MSTNYVKPEQANPLEPRLCQDSFLRTYLEYTRHMESPEVFHFWSAISIVAASMGRSTIIQFGPGKIYPNLYLILVAPSGIVRKTSASDLAVDLVRMANPALEVFEGKGSINAIMAQMAEIYKRTGESRIYLYSGELKCLIGGLMSSSSILEDLTELYGCKNTFMYRTKNVGCFTLYNTCINLFGVSTPEWLTDLKGNDFIRSGFSARILYINAKETDRRYYKPKLPENHHELLAAMVADLITIWKLQGPFVITPDAEEYWETWYMDRRNFAFQDDRLGPYMERKDKHMIKIAMVLSASESNRMVIEKRHIIGAINALAGIEPGMLDTYNAVGYSQQGIFVDKLLAQMSKSKSGGVTKRELIRVNYSRMSLKELDDALLVLMQAGKVIRSIEKAKNGRFLEVYKINDPSFLEMEEERETQGQEVKSGKGSKSGGKVS